MSTVAKVRTILQESIIHSLKCLPLSKIAVFSKEEKKFSFILGRSIEKVDIRPFINNLPFGRDTSKFSTQDASGSTSQCANIIEALETGTKCLLIDEVTTFFELQSSFLYPILNLQINDTAIKFTL